MANDPNNRIEELEARVRELSRLVDHLTQEHVQARPEAAEESQGIVYMARAAVDRARQTLVRDVRLGMDLAVGGPANEPLEARIGGIWLGRVAVVLLMTALVTGAALSSRWEILGAPQKVGIGYGVSAAFIAYGMSARRSRYLFPRTVLGAGLALLYFTTYAAFFVDAMQLFPHRTFALPGLLGCLVIILCIAHFQRSKAAAGITLFLVYYTVVLSCITGAVQQDAVYALATTGVLALAAFVFHLFHRWMFLAWSAVAATYGTYSFFFLHQPPTLDVPADVYFWWSNGFLTLCYLLFAITCIMDAHRGLGGVRNSLFLAALNSTVYFALTWPSIHARYPEHVWRFLLGASAVLAAMAVIAEFAGDRRHRMVPLFAAKAALLLALALQGLLPTTWFVVVLAAECLGLALLYVVSGMTLLAVLDLFLLAAAVAGAFYTARQGGPVLIAGYTVPASLAFTGAAAVLLGLASAVCEHVPRYVPSRGTLSVAPGWLAQLHAAGSALAISILLVTEFGDHPPLPFYFAGAGVAAALAGLLLGTPQLNIAGVLLLMAGHTCYHVLLLLKRPVFLAQPHYYRYTILLVLLTFVMAWIWERCLYNAGSRRGWEHHCTAAIPYMAGAYLAAVLVSQAFAGDAVPLSQGTLGAGLAAAGASIGAVSVGIAGLVACAVALLYAAPLLLAETGGAFENGIPLWFVGIAAAWLAAERVAAAAFRRHAVSPGEGMLFRFTLLLGVTVLCVWGIAAFVPPAALTLGWLGFAVVLMGLGAVFHSGLYRWAALTALMAAIIRVFTFDLVELPPANRVISFGVLGAVLLIISWLYSRRRREANHRPLRSTSEGPSTDGSEARRG